MVKKSGRWLDNEEKGSGYATGVDMSEAAQAAYEEHFDG